MPVVSNGLEKASYSKPRSSNGMTTHAATVSVNREVSILCFPKVIFPTCQEHDRLM